MAFLSSKLQVKVNLDYYVGRKYCLSSKHSSSSMVMNSSRRSWSHPLLNTAVDKDRKPELLVRRLFSGKNALEEEETYFTALSEKGKIYHLPFDGRDFTHPISVAGSCNGWVCLWGYLNDPKFVKFVLWNPSTNNYNFLPPSNLRPSTPSYCPFNSFYDFSLCYCAGFGFDAKSGDYNIIRFVTHFFTDDQGEGSFAGCEERTELYSLRDNCWTEFASPATPISESDSFNRYSVYLNGIYYWLASRESEGETTCTTIISLDFADKSCYSYIPFPDTGKISRYDDYNLVNFNGSLCFILYPMLGTDKTFKVWVMNCDCDDKSWTRAFDVRVPNAEMPLGFSSDGRFIYFESIYRQQLVYDLTTGKSWFNRHDYPKAMQLVPCQLS